MDLFQRSLLIPQKENINTKLLPWVASWAQDLHLVTIRAVGLGDGRCPRGPAPVNSQYDMVASWSSAVPSRFWSGMYNRFEKGLQPRQSVTDYLMAVKEETQQLEEELEALEEVRHFPNHCSSMEACQDSGYVRRSHTFRIFSQWIIWNTAPPDPQVSTQKTGAQT